LIGALSDEPGARHSQVYANHGQRADDAHRGRIDWASHPAI
jgi:hypothetical protein